MTEALSIQLNGVACNIMANPETPLLFCLRDNLKHKGTRFGCGSGHCGACTVLVAGRAVQSCNTPLWSVVGREVTTAEGLNSDPVGRVVREAFIELQAVQCGYCINGILMSTTAVLKSNPKPERPVILASLERNLCRCGTQARILRAIDLAIARLAGDTP
jgi:nicotinate dehydrogenase subunit A